MSVRGTALATLALLASVAGWGGSVDAASLAAIRERGTLNVCAHPEALPFSSQDPAQPGLQLELGGAIAKALGVRMHVDWIVFSRHARRVDCDAVMGSIVQDRGPDKGPRRGPRLSRPYASSGYLLVVPRAAVGLNRPEDVKGGKIGVEHASWPHYLLDSQGIATASFASQTEILEALAGGGIAAAMVTGPYLGWYLKQHPEGAVKPVEAYVPHPDLRWNVAVGLRNADDALVQAVNQALDRLLADGTIQGIFAKYGITYVPPLQP